MESFLPLLVDSDRAHIAKILSEPTTPRVTAREHVEAFLEKNVFFGRGAGEAFRALGADEREQTLSEFLWRVTCHLDGSVTEVMGKSKFDLGSGLFARPVVMDGRDIFILEI